MEDSDFVSIDDQLVALNLDLTLEAAVGGVVLEHVDLNNKINEIFQTRVVLEAICFVCTKHFYDRLLLIL